MAAMALFGPWSLSTMVNAQVATTYTFTQSVGSYVPINGGQLIASGTFGAGVTQVNIPTFTFDGVEYTRMWVSNNGFLTFGSAPASSANNPLSGTAGYAGAVSAFGSRLASATSGAPEVRSAVVGDEIVTQWRDVRRNITTSERINFQIRMNTVTGAIRIVYGALTGQDASTLHQPQVGLRGPNNNFTTNVNNRRLGSGTQNWPTSLPGTANNSVMRFSSASPAKAYVNGLTYTWAPPACNAIPDPGAIAGPGATCADEPFLLSVVEPSITVGISYQWQYSSTGPAGPWVDFGGDVHEVTASQVQATWYRCAVSCYGFGTGYSDVLAVAMSPVSECYCDADALSAGSERITRVVVGDIDHASSANVGYEDHTGVSTELMAGITYPFTVEFGWVDAPNGKIDDQVLIWIDLNGDGDFNDADELVHASAPGFGPHTGSIILPHVTEAITTRMRIRLHDTHDGSSYANTPNSDPCGSSTYGQVEDYTVTIVPKLLYTMTSGNFADNIWSRSPSIPPNGDVPDQHTSIVLRNGHEVTLSANGNARNMVLEGGASLAVDAGRTLALYGSQVMLDGTLTMGDNSRMALRGPELTTLVATGTKEFFDLEVNTPAGTMAQGALHVRGTLSLAAGGFDATDADVRLVSNATRTGRLGPVAAGATYVGDLTMQRYIPGGATNWRLLGSPVAGRTVADWNDDFFTAGFPGSDFPNFYSGGDLWPSVRWYDETHPGSGLNDGLVGVSSIGHSLEVGRGYAVWSGDALGGTNPFIVDVTGPPTIAHVPVALPLSYTNTGNPGADGWNLVSNPLPSAIDFQQLARGADVQNAYWIFNPATGSTASWADGFSTNGANGRIQSSQGFWMRTTGSNVAISVSESAKSASQSGGVFGGMQQPIAPMVRMTITRNEAGNTFRDEALVVFKGGSQGFRSDEGDARKLEFAHPQAPQLATVSADGTLLAINRFGPLTEAVSIPLHVSVGMDGSYSLTATDMTHLTGLSCLTLEDLQTGDIIPLQEGAIYSFTASARSNGSDPRFMIHASAPVQRTVEPATCFGLADGRVAVDAPGDVPQVALLDPQGSVLLVHNGGSVEFTGLPAGNYLLSVTSDAGCGDLVSPIVIAEPMPLELAFTMEPATCTGPVGRLEVEVLGGTAPYTMAWSNGHEGATLDAAAGSYDLLVTDAQGCSMQALAVAITGDLAPEPSFAVASDLVFTYDQVPFAYTGSPVDSWHWDFGDGHTGQDSAPVHVYAMPGTYMVTLTVQVGNCIAQATGTVVVQVSTGIRQLDDTDFRAWHDGYQLVVDHGFASGQVLYVEVLDATGKLYVQAQGNATPGRIHVPADGLASGVWFVRITHDGRQQTRRVPIIR